jgi:predicted amidohydrolase YtcJ
MSPTPLSADLVFVNGPVLTMEPACRADWVAVRGSKIIGVGRGQGYRRFRGEMTRVIDLKGSALVPGFHDAHAHLFASLAQRRSLDVGPRSVRSIPELRQRIRERAASLAPGAWVHAAGYHEAAFWLSIDTHALGSRRRERSNIRADHASVPPCNRPE